MEKTPISFTFNGKKYLAEFSIQRLEGNSHVWVWFNPEDSGEEEFSIVYPANDPLDIGRWDQFIDEFEGELIPRLPLEMVQAIGDEIISFMA